MASPAHEPDDAPLPAAPEGVSASTPSLPRQRQYGHTVETRVRMILQYAKCTALAEYHEEAITARGLAHRVREWFQLNHGFSPDYRTVLETFRKFERTGSIANYSISGRRLSKEAFDASPIVSTMVIQKGKGPFTK